MCQLTVQIAAETSEDAIPYVVTISDAAGDIAIAMCSTSAVAYAAYYAAAREHFGRSLTLRRGRRVLADSRLH